MLQDWQIDQAVAAPNSQPIARNVSETDMLDFALELKQKGDYEKHFKNKVGTLHKTSNSIKGPPWKCFFCRNLPETCPKNVPARKKIKQIKRF